MVKNKVAGYRTMLGLNQTQLGEHLGITKQAVSNKERGVSAFNDREKVAIKILINDSIDPNAKIDDIFF